MICAGWVAGAERVFERSLARTRRPGHEDFAPGTQVVLRVDLIEQLISCLLAGPGVNSFRERVQEFVELLEVDRLDQVAVAARFSRLDAVSLLAPAGERDDGD